LKLEGFKKDTQFGLAGQMEYISKRVEATQLRSHFGQL